MIKLTFTNANIIHDYKQGYKLVIDVSNGKKTFKEFKHYVYSIDFTRIEKLDKEESQ